MIDSDLLERVKEVSLPVLLAEHGIMPERNRDPYGNARSHMYVATYRNESHASLSVFLSNTKGQWLYRDHTTQEVGTNLDLLVRLGYYQDWREAAMDIAARYLGEGSTPALSVTPSKVNPHPGSEEKTYQGSILSVASISGSPVERYVVGTRKIPLSIAERYLNFVRYTYAARSERSEKTYYGIGWQTIKKSWAIRWPIDEPKKGKCFIGPACYSFFPRLNGSSTRECAVCEGVFDMLSFVTIHNDQVLDAVVLNSVENVKDVIPELAKYNTINCFLDNDDAGKKATAKIREVYHDIVVDHSISYQGYNDLNDYLKAKS